VLSQRDLLSELWAILNEVRCIPPSDGRKGQDPFHQGKGAVADHILCLIDRVKGAETHNVKARETSAELRHRERLARTTN
jgi:hypothetical protein